MASTTRRPAPSRTKPPRARVNASEDQIVDKMASLSLSKPRTKGKAKATMTVEEQRLSAMRAVNSASQELSGIVKSGWKRSSDVPPAKKSSAFADASTSATMAAEHLALLRDMSPGDLDIEESGGKCARKAHCFGDGFDAALAALQEMHPRLCTLLAVDIPQSKSADNLHLLSIPLPQSSPDPILLTLVTTFLLHSLTTISHPISTSTGSKSALISLADVLSTTPTVLAWSPLLSGLPSVHTDYIFTRAYSVLIKVSSAFQTSPKDARHAFITRDYAVSCLACTSPGKIEPRSFWDQAIKSAGTYVKSLGSVPEEHDVATPVVLNAFAQIITRVQSRSDAESFMSGKGFIAFCECWTSFANRIGDIATLDRIAIFIGNQPGSSTITVADKGESKPKPQVPCNFVLEYTQLCNTLAQTTASLDSKLSSGSEVLGVRIRETTKALLRDGTASLLTPAGGDEEVLRLSGKLQRAMERTRRTAIKFLDSHTASGHVVDIQALLETLADILEHALKEKPTADGITAVLDTLFVLARTKLNVHNPHTHGPPHAFLKRAAAFLDIDCDDVTADKATYARCISGAFHNLAGRVYAWNSGSRSAQRCRRSDSDKAPKTEEAWRQLREQLWRRRELLGVCYSKIGDRKLAFESFVDCVKSFPYSLYRFEDQIHREPFGFSPAAVQLGTIVDRVTYLGACELLLTPKKVSALTLWPGDASITGALLDRQIQSLHGSRWKESTRNAIQTFLRDALEVYGETDMPIRRARTLVRCLDFAYHTGPQALADLGSPSDMGEEVERVLVQKSLGKDSELSAFCAQYRAEAHLWLALHAHRRADPDQSAIVAHRVALACKILEPVASPRRTQPESDQEINAKAGWRNFQAGSCLASSSAKKGNFSRSRDTSTKKERWSVRKKCSTKSSRLILFLKVLPTLDDLTKVSTHPKASIPIDNIEKFFGLLQLVTRILGLLAHSLLKVQLLDITKRICEQHPESITDGRCFASVSLVCSHFLREDYINVCIELGVEYMKLGKTGRANGLFKHALNAVKRAKVSDDVCVMLYLRHAEFLALSEDISESEALTRAQRLGEENKSMSTLERVQCRVGRLEKAAIACHVFALIQYSREDIAASLEAMLQSLRLWNRAVDTLARLNPSASKPVEKDNPFDMAEVRNALPNGDSGHQLEQVIPPKAFPRRPSMGGLEWRVSEGLLATLFALCEAYFTRGSAREAEYFAQQAYELAQSLNAPAMAGRALAKKGELQLHQRHLQEAHDTLMQAAALLQNLPGKDTADIQRLCGDYNQLSSQEKDAQQLYEEAARILEELDRTFGIFDAIPSSPRKSIEPSREVLLPELFATVLRQHIWLLRDDGNEYSALLQRFLALPAGSRTKAQENSLLAKLTLHEVYGRFRTDMFLSSLTESTIALPMGMSTDKTPALSPSTHDILHTLDRAEQLFWLDFTLFSRRGDVSRVRDAVVSLALIRAFQTSLGKSGNQDPVLVAGLLDVSTAITLSREMLETIQHKFPPLTMADDLQWPLASRTGSPISLTQTVVSSRFPSRRNSFGSELDVSDDEADDDERSLQDYWESVRSKYQSQAPDISTLSASQMSGIPPNWTIVHISVTDDKSTLFVTRQNGGNAQTAPLVFCVPLKGRRDDDEDEHLTFEDALREFNDIVKLSDEGTRGAVHVKDDPEARARWWKERTALDTRMRELLENIEFCWLGAFKTILSPRANLTAAAISDLRIQFDKIFHRALRFQDTKAKVKPAGKHKRLPSESQIPSKVALDDVLLECFSTLSPKCREEELEDLVFFILDLYQFHGVPVAIAEVDLVQVSVDLRGVLEDHHARLTRRKGVGPASKMQDDEHMFLILDKNIQGLPWESIPILRGRSRGWLAHGPGTSAVVDRAVVDPRKAYCLLNPSGDLVRTEGRFKSWVQDMEKVGWQSVIGKPPSEQQFLDALRKKDLVVYFGHGGAEQYLRSHKIRNLPRCAATMLWGCSSGTLRDMGDFDRVGTPYNYMLAGCPTLVANLWDVTDRDIDIFSQSVFDKLKLTADGVRNWDAAREGQISLVAAVAQSRTSCKLKYLTGAAPVVYGIPFYL
ncbi:Cysteine peptidase C50 [Mycena sanguinolenta]|uniref:separase n=1 Tax=Mycena sanguinolenta TaxID=230812 RepID=A0A8H7D607_9AGAR|nr:Cysteine peptidase C50 [Mycena sanguinolenta]